MGALSSVDWFEKVVAYSNVLDICIVGHEWVVADLLNGFSGGHFGDDFFAFGGAVKVEYVPGVFIVMQGGCIGGRFQLLFFLLHLLFESHASLVGVSVGPFISIDVHGILINEYISK